MQRKSFIKTAILGSLAIGLSSYTMKKKTHFLTLSFDDGFKKSFYTIADIFEKYKLKACLNIIASGHLTDFKKPDNYHNAPRGSFDDWNVLKKRGHEIMPHTWDHQNLTEIPFDQAKENMDKCLDYFTKNLKGFEASKAVYNFAYNASNEELVKYALSRFRAVRTGGWDILGEGKKLNPFPASRNPVRLGCWSFGPDNADKWVEEEVREFLDGTGGWLVLNLHGLDEEGWGPVSSTFLDNLLKKLVKIDYLDILPAGVALEKYAF